MAQTSQHVSETLARADAETFLAVLGFQGKESGAAGLGAASTTAGDLCSPSMIQTLSCPEGGNLLWKGSCAPGAFSDTYKMTSTADFSDCGRDGVVYHGKFVGDGLIAATEEGFLDVTIEGTGDGLTASVGDVTVSITAMAAVFRASQDPVTGDWILSLSALTAATSSTEADCSVDLDEAICSSGAGDGSAFDTDADGVLDAFDNCRGVRNPSQLDADDDGLGSLCDREEGIPVSMNFEDCQNGVDDNGDGSTDCDDALCADKTVCTETSEPPTVAVCGDSFHSSALGELCDFSASPDGCATGVCSLSCLSCIGDGVVAPSEQCDDGNTSDGDGCSSFGGIEAGYVCNGAQPSACAPIGPEVCGNDIDDDQDDVFDCKDSDCSKDPLCQEDCTNQIDDDLDGLIDCMDLDCGCKETDCHDFLDNDGDKLIDCKGDPDCWVKGAGCVETCEFGNDEDADGFVDCDDPDCAEDPACNLCGNGRIDGTKGEQCDPLLGDNNGSQVCVDRYGGGICDPNNCQCCGDGSCTTGETEESCPDDCVVPPAMSCGDGICSEGESAVACPEECGTTPGCGNGICDGANEDNPETVDNCPDDCGKIVCQADNEKVATVCDGEAECSAFSIVPGGYDEIDCGPNEPPCSKGSIYCDVDQKCHVPCDGVQGCASTDLIYNDEGPIWCGESGATCHDGSDNDFDGNTDCDDVDCFYDCEMNCTDKADDNNNQKIDCDDPDCVADPACIEILCDDTVDDDGDGKTDCDDPDCWISGGDCFEVCTGGFDEDGDKAADCSDADCQFDKACAPPPPK